MRFTNVLTGAAVPLHHVDGAARLPAGEVLGALPAVWILGTPSTDG